MPISPTRPSGRGIVALCATLALVVLAAIGGVSATAWAGPPTAEVTLVAESPSGGVSNALVVDPVAHRVYQPGPALGSVQVLDTRGDGLSPVATIAGLGEVSAVAIDVVRQRLFVADQGLTTTLRVVDIDPASASVNTVIHEFVTAGRGIPGLAVDRRSGAVLMSNRSSNDVMVIDPRAGLLKTVPVPAEPVGIVYDDDRHVAYVASIGGPSLTTIFGTGVSTVPLAERPLALRYAADRLFVLAVGGSATVTSYEAGSMRVLARSAHQPSATGLAVDGAHHAVYVISGSVGSPGLSILNLGTLETEFSGPHDPVFGIAVDDDRGELYTNEHASSFVLRRFTVQRDPLPTVDRLGGADRFDVSARVSLDRGERDIPVAYVASGAVFADALSGSASAGRSAAPVLLVTRDTVPASVATELTRLQPRSIVILGGEASVSVDVAAELLRYTRTVSRIGGADRYEVAAGVSAAAFPGGSSVAYLASGEVFADALSGSAAAGLDQAPVLLTRKGELPPAVRAELVRLAPTTIIVLGGPASVAEPVLAELAALGGVPRQVDRIGGADRYEVSAAVAARFPRSTSSAYIASGAVFPDALAGAAAAIPMRSPVLLVPSDRIPAAVGAQLERLRPYRIVVLGGANSVADSVQTAMRRYLAF